jgi:exosortase
VSNGLHLCSRNWLLPALVIAYLWFTLINHLRIEWTVNPQYGYGWAVPILCLYLACLGRQRSDGSGQMPEFGIQNSVIRNLAQPCCLSHAVFTILRCALALAWLPLRMVQEANPEWRLVSWALALAVISFTLLVIYPVLHHHQIYNSPFVFPLLFFLVAVPWPTGIEGPLIQALTQANATCAIEIINLIGIPALQHGNLIEIGTGVVGIDEACSGIRSFQATLMVSLFLGGLYQLTFLRRFSLCLSGFALSFVFNVGRTTLLTWVATRNGIIAIERWHDPAGGILLVLCFTTVWLLALSCRPSRELSLIPAPPACIKNAIQNPQTRIRFSKSRFALLIWFLVCEISVAAWYRLHETDIPHAVKWTVTWPTNNPSFRELPFSDQTRQNLRYDEGFNAKWLGVGDLRWQVIFLRWDPGKIAVHLAQGHSPQTCLPASGREIVSTSNVLLMEAGGLALPFRHYVVNDGGRPLHIFYCLSEDRGTEQELRPPDLTLWNRLGPVLYRRRNLGQRSLEVAIWGVGDEREAEDSLISELKKLIKMEK